MKERIEREPWNPSIIAILSLFFSIIPGSILHSLNYERLGASYEKKNTYLTNIFLVFLLLFFCLSYELILASTFNFIVSLYFYKSQAPLYKNHLAESGSTGSIKFPLIFSIVLSILFYTTAYLVDYATYYDDYQLQNYVENENWDEAEKILLKK